MRFRYVLFGAGSVLVLALLLVGWRVFASPYRYQGSLIDPAPPAADFTLTDQFEQPFRLSDQRGKVVLIFFGYTNCPDVCPVTLTEYHRIKEALGDQADRVTFVFITVDPERDTSERLRAHLGNYDTAIIGLTGERAELESVWKSYGVYQARRDLGSAAGFLVDHTARTYLIDPQGNWRLSYPFEMDRSAIIEDVRHILRE